MDQNGSSRDESYAGAGAGDSTRAGAPAGVGDSAGENQTAVPSLSVYEAEPDVADTGAEGSTSFGPPYRDGFTGSLALQAAESLTQDEASTVLARLDHLVRWAQAQQAKMLHRMETVFRDDLLEDIGREDPGLTFSLAAEEAAAILRLPTNTAKMLMSDAGRLCRTHTATLRNLEEGTLSYGHVQAVLDQSQNIPEADLAGFETDLLGLAAAGQTSSQFRVKARRMREKTYPETINVRHKTAFERRRVCLAPDEDGMSWLSALLPAARAQLIYTQLTTASRGEQAAGDPRMVDQLRADILADLLDGDTDEDSGSEPGTGTGAGGGAAGADRRGSHDGTDGTGGTGGTGGRGGDLDSRDVQDNQNNRRNRARARTEILVLITAETLFGADEQPAELHGYGPISSETARKLARQAAHWTPVQRDPQTDEILRVGRRRKVPAGLQRWLRARDGTCRFPGCRTNAVISEIDHTKPWAHGGTTDHDNLEHLCRRHHMFKSRGFWKARQRNGGVIEWTSPGGRTYRTDPHLTLAHGQADSGQVDSKQGAARGTAAKKPVALRVSCWGSAGEAPEDYGDDPPPF